MGWLNLEVQQQVIAGLLIALICWTFGLFASAINVALSFYRKMRVSAYINAISFGESEILFALRDYVKPRFSKLDPSRCEEPREALDEADGCLCRFVDKFIAAGDKKHLFIYADSGMGKTTFLINYFHANRGRVLRPKRDMVLVSLARPSAEAEIAETPLSKQRSTILLLDALDEDPHIYSGAAARVNRLLELSSNYKAVIVTCRSQFFADDDSLPFLSGVSRAGPTPAAESKHYEIECVYISPFNDNQIRRYLNKRFPGLLNIIKRYRAKSLVNRVPYLPVRPMLLNHISDVLSFQKGLRTRADIYQAIISSWARREDRWITPKDLLNFSADLAFELYLNRDSRGGELCSVIELEQLAATSDLKIKTSSLTGRSLLNRTADGSIKFSHRSILEYFVANRASSAAPGLSALLTDQMSIFLMEVLGISDGKSEESISRRRIRLTTLAPKSRNGYSTNFNLFKPINQNIGLHTLMAAPVSVLDGIEYEGLSFSDFLVDMYRHAGLGGSTVELRVMIPLSHSLDSVNAYISAWASEFAVLSHIRMDSASLRAALGFSPDREICLVGVGDSIERLDWTCHFRSDLIGSAIDLGVIERSPRVSFFQGAAGGELQMFLVSGRPVSGPLASFGILSGGSYFSIERRLFTRLPRNEVEADSSRVGEALPQEIAKIPAFERWSER